MLLLVMQIATAKSQSVMRGASHQSAIFSCLTISNTRLPCLPSRYVSPGRCGIQGKNYVLIFQGSGM